MGLKWGGPPSTTRRRSWRRLAYSLAGRRARRGALRHAVQAVGVALVAAATIGSVWLVWAALATHTAQP